MSDLRVDRDLAAVTRQRPIELCQEQAAEDLEAQAQALLAQAAALRAQRTK